jgi:hypothetical protein
MSEYIDLDTPLEAFRLRGNQREPISTTLRELLDFNKIPYTAADVVPVRHGHKITHNRPISGYWASGLLDGGINGMEGRVWVMPIMDNPVDYCSECGKRLDDTFQNYCPNCGCRMDLDDNDG